MVGPKKKKLAKKPSGGGSLIGMRSRIKKVAGQGKKKAAANPEGKSPFTLQRLIVILVAVAIGAVIAFGMSRR